MNELQVFEHQDFGPIRVIEQDGEPWFVAADVCRALEIGNPFQAMTRLDEDERTLISNEGGKPTNFVNEPGLYTLVLSSRKPEARTFKRWITHEVLPKIRKTGSYSLVAVSAPVDQRILTTDDYLRAAVIVANCRNERLPYVLGFLEKGGWEIPRLQATRTPISVIIKQTLEKTGMTLTELERRTELPHESMCRYKNGRRTPRPEKYDYIVGVLSTLADQE